ncbi:MAG: hypothetical protein LBP67_02185 [Bacteroidales bacterium]|jgi:hypothetical protein|nr:hypothetical protein [Bacteroidales bacterium]
MKLFIAIPLLRESENLESLLSDLGNQSLFDFKVLFCVNNPEEWHNNPEKQNDIIDNKRTLEILRDINNLDIEVIDKSSEGNGFDIKNAGVGMARRVLMDRISEIASGEDIIISLDGDTHFNEDYFLSIRNNFERNEDALALSIPYYHPLTNNEEQNNCILRYEIYMRHYMINMLKINNPYAFTALGSAIALPVWAYRKIGGIVPRKSGEDFYLLQSLRKTGRIVLWNEEHVYPQARFSDRVAFGTGPAMIKGISGDWNSYPFYNEKFFNEVEETYSLFKNLFEEDIETPMSEFLRSSFKTEDLWSPLRKNYKLPERFIHACMVKVDALKILQYLRFRQKKSVQEKEYDITQTVRNELYNIENKLRFENL